MITTLTILICLFTVVFYAVHLYRKDEEDDNWADSLDAEALTEVDELNEMDLYGDYTGFMDYYFCSGDDIVSLEEQLHIIETVCKEHNLLINKKQKQWEQITTQYLN